MFKVDIVPDAEVELDDTYEWYEAARVGLGDEFIEAYRGVRNRMGEMPAQFQAIEPDVHRALIPGFPYAVFFTIESDRVVILSVMDCRREPRFGY